MQALLKKQLKQNLTLFLFSSLLFASSTMAASPPDYESLARARAGNSTNKIEDHSAHEMPSDESKMFHGIFYGYLPCKDCDGIKTTLSLKQNNNYLIVTQYARESSREYFERGKYTWNEQEKTVVLTPSKGGTEIHRYHIENKNTLIQLKEDGSRNADAERYTLRSSDTAKTRDVHIH
jgi:uncharacterized lipoprotein NlpE involved in copper resistance